MQVNGFYLKRRSVLKVMRHIIADELMVPWESGLPTGGLPNIAFEPRKPEPLGTMFKCLLDNDTKVMSTLCLLYTSPSPRDVEESRMPSSA